MQPDKPYASTGAEGSWLMRCLIGGLCGALLGFGLGILTFSAAGVMRAAILQGSPLQELRVWWPLLLALWVAAAAIIAGSGGALGGVVGGLAGPTLGGRALAVGAAVGGFFALSVMLLLALATGGEPLIGKVLFTVAALISATTGGAFGSLMVLRTRL